MHNLKRMGKTFKGLAGECMFRLVKTKSYLTRFFPIDFVLRRHDESLNEVQKNFLIRNWLSFDAIEFIENEIVIYEIKTRNVEYDTGKYRTQITQNSVNLLNEAKKLEFTVKLAKVLLHNNWEYEIKISQFNYDVRRMWIHTNNKYDKSKPEYKTKNM